MPPQVATVIAMANPQLRERLKAELVEHGIMAQTPADIHDLTRVLDTCELGTVPRRCVLVLDEAFIFPHVYEECARIQAASRLPLTVLLLVEPRTRTRWDWTGVDHILKLPMNASAIACRVVDSLAAQE